jgi:hypothetical protein
MKQILAAILATILVFSCGFVPAAATDANSGPENPVLAQESASVGEVTPDVQESETVSILQEDWEIYDEATSRSILDNSVPVIINRGWYSDG